MPEPIYVLVNFALIFIEIISFAMFIRAILSWFTDGGGKFTQFLYVITEPAIMPIRKLLVKMNWLQDSPIDFSFTLTFLVLMVIELLLSSFL
ncbi:MAG: YggT family protein [Clostridia bacterium]|nr:YggT family protein [Clostridia bacterium]